MKFKYRALLFTFGILVATIGVIYLRAGSFAYHNGKGQQMFSPAVIATGVLLSLGAFLPSDKWMYRRITTKTPKVEFKKHNTRKKKSER